ncbi:MAG: glycosyltransferase [Prolixibacteraceae bacterium]|nr:glycosyltransferase [Prolixibacteraceae bacterium]
MNVLMFGWEFPPNISGGLGTACKGIVNGLSAFDDIHVLFVVPKLLGNEKTSRFELIDAEKVASTEKIVLTEYSHAQTTLEVSSRLLPYDNPEEFSKQKHFSTGEMKQSVSEHNPHKFHFSGKYGPDLFDEINNYALVAQTIAEKHQFDLIHVHDWLTFPAGISARQISGKPLVAHVHSTDFDRSGGKINPRIYNIEKQGFEQADSIITVSNRIKQRLVDDYGIQANKITTVYNAIDPQLQTNTTKKRKKSEDKIVTFLGRITIQKGPEYFMEVARLVLQRMKNVRFIMAGNGDMMAHMVELCARYGISDKFRFAGFLKGNEINEVLQMSDIFIMPSVSEPFGIVPLEAMQAKVPVIISRQSGVSELIRNVIKTDFWDIQAMADAIHGIIGHRSLSKTMAFEGNQEVNRLNWNMAAGNIRDVYFNTI